MKEKLPKFIKIKAREYYSEIKEFEEEGEVIINVNCIVSYIKNETLSCLNGQVFRVTDKNSKQRLSNFFINNLI